MILIWTTIVAKSKNNFSRQCTTGIHTGRIIHDIVQWRNENMYCNLHTLGKISCNYFHSTVPWWPLRPRRAPHPRSESCRGSRRGRRPPRGCTGQPACGTSGSSWWGRWGGTPAGSASPQTVAAAPNRIRMTCENDMQSRRCYVFFKCCYWYGTITRHRVD